MRRPLALVLATLLGAVGVVVSSAGPAYACSCAPAPQPRYAFVGRIVDDLGLVDAPGDDWDAHAFRVEVTDAVRGVSAGEEIEISLIPAERRDGDLVAVNTCGLDDDLVVGEAYQFDVASLEGMISCGTTIRGEGGTAPGAVPADPATSARARLLLAAGLGAASLATGALVVAWWLHRRRRPAESS